MSWLTVFSLSPTKVVLFQYTSMSKANWKSQLKGIIGYLYNSFVLNRILQNLNISTKTDLKLRYVSKVGHYGLDGGGDGRLFQIKEKNLTTIFGTKQNNNNNNMILVNLTGRDFTTITACVLYTFQWKHLQIAVLILHNTVQPCAFQQCVN